MSWFTMGMFTAQAIFLYYKLQRKVEWSWWAVMSPSIVMIVLFLFWIAVMSLFLQ